MIKMGERHEISMLTQRSKGYAPGVGLLGSDGYWWNDTFNQNCRKNPPAMSICEGIAGANVQMLAFRQVRLIRCIMRSFVLSPMRGRCGRHVMGGQGKDSKV